MAKPTKDRWINVRFGAEDYATVKARAQELRISIGTYIRMTLLQSIREAK